MRMGTIQMNFIINDIKSASKKYAQNSRQLFICYVVKCPCEKQTALKCLKLHRVIAVSWLFYRNEDTISKEKERVCVLMRLYAFELMNSSDHYTANAWSMLPRILMNDNTPQIAAHAKNAQAISHTHTHTHQTSNTDHRSSKCMCWLCEHECRMSPFLMLCKLDSAQ